MFDSPILLFNSLGRELSEFKPLKSAQVSMYSCGPTVYNYVHIGNLRAYIFTDTLRRVLQFKGFDVKHVMNITDVGHLTSDADEGEDKMELSAKGQGKTVWEIAQFYTDHFFSDIDQLNIVRPTKVLKATDYIPQMIEFAEKLERGSFTYLLDDGLYFDISKLPEYGKIALLDLAGQEAGARLGVKHGKRNPADFAIWRFSPKNQKRLMEWTSRWGTGAPGWHLECSAMSVGELGHHFDIHTGGIDHRQVHHCNEIAQNQAYLGNNNPGADWWIHNEFLVLGSNEKMSKSSGNFLRLQSLIDSGVHPLVYRYFCLQASYRTPLEYTNEALIAARTGLSRLIKRIDAIKQAAPQEPLTIVDEQLSSGKSLAPAIDKWAKETLDLVGKLPATSASDQQQLRIRITTWLIDFDKAIADDLNTSKALALLNELIADNKTPPQIIVRLIAVADLIFGLRLLHLTAEDLVMRPAQATISQSQIQELIDQRVKAKKEKDFAKADQIRSELSKLGVAIHDTPNGTTWEWLPSNN